PLLSAQLVVSRCADRHPRRSARRPDKLHLADRASAFRPVAAADGSLSGIGVMRSFRSSSLPAPAADLVCVLADRRAVLVTGARGFIERRLVEALADAGHDVTVLTRDPHNASVLRAPFRLVTSLDQIAGDARIDPVINLAGEPVGNALWTRRKRRNI